MLHKLREERRTKNSVIAAFTLVQAVAKDNRQSGNGPPWLQNPLTDFDQTWNRLYGMVAGMTTDANSCGAVTAWVVSANT